jgi:hypothetical protein
MTVIARIRDTDLRDRAALRRDANPDAARVRITAKLMPLVYDPASSFANNNITTRRMMNCSIAA